MWTGNRLGGGINMDIEKRKEELLLPRINGGYDQIYHTYFYKDENKEQVFSLE